MDIAQFYDRDERRRTSAEIELGTEWLDRTGMRFELSWVEDTGELYVMREPAPPGWEDPFGGIHITGSGTDSLQVTLLGTVADRAPLERALDGWEHQVGQPDSVHWLIDRLTTGGIFDPAKGADVPD